MGDGLKLPGVYQDLLSRAYRGQLQRHCENLQDAIDELPRWKWLRKFHLERQLLAAVLASEAYMIGWGDAVRSLRNAEIADRNHSR